MFNIKTANTPHKMAAAYAQSLSLGIKLKTKLSNITNIFGYKC